ncbi:D-2-hydroxyacid dehydrogenase [Kineococcus rubinsiae]|uniref:D-2-hydroxyacid dehydrogenase n=1 Tax=Kineococcus rubinsiae TaxID=2609562 RepID=UPI001430227D|nr:D-2-hydroxyacid dehydrogenase [Kineococcus rubinsiae]NIZ92596.1 D-2-hydroxyacid dehydrogenase [Kineococcus rubinsiae]
MTDRPDLLVIADAADPELDALASRAQVRRLHPASNGLAAALAEADAVVVWNCVVPGFEASFDEALAATGGLPRLRWVHTTSAGPDRLLFPGLLGHPATLTCSRGVLDVDMAEYVLTCVLALLKDVPATVRLQGASRWRHRRTRSLAGTRGLVVGAGSIGTATGRLLDAMGVSVDGVVREPRPAAAPFGALHAPGDLASIVGEYDVVVVTAPLTTATEGLVSAEVIAAMKPSAVFVNVGRGPVVDEEALLTAVKRGRLSGVALDVFTVEPLPADSPWWDEPRAIVSPHLAGDSEDFLLRLQGLLLEQLQRFTAGEELLHVVDAEHGYATS